MMIRKSILWICWALLFGYSPQLQGQQFSIRKYTAIDGLPQSEVRAMAEDQNGYLWIATQGGGLARFDGREFKVYTTLDGLLSNIVTTLMIDRQGNIWMAHPRGITKFDGHSFTKFIQPAVEEGARRIRRIFELGDSVFFTVHPGMVGKIFNDTVRYWSNPIAPNKTIYFTYVKPGRSIVHYLNDSSLVYFRGDERRILSHKNIFGKAMNIFSMGNEVILKSESGFYRIDMDNHQLIKQEINISRHIIFYDTAHKVFWTRGENGLYKEKIEGGELLSELVYKDAEISQVLADEEGNTWIGTLGDGLIRHFKQDFDRCGSDRLKLIMAINKDNEGGTWIGSSNSGLWRIAKGKIKTYPLPNKSTGIFSIKINEQGTVYVSNKTGLGIYDKTKGEFNWMGRSDGLSSSYVSALETDDKGGLWIGTVMGGLNYFDGKAISKFTDRLNFKTKNISALKFLPSSRSLFVGTDFGMSEIHSSGAMSNLKLPEFENASILSINSYQDSLLLIGSGGSGFAVYNPKTRRKKIFTQKDGLSSGFVFFVAADEKNQIWIGTVNGINRVMLNNRWEITERLQFGFDNGLTGIETNQNAFYLSPDEKYFGLIDGLYQFNDLKSENLKSFNTHLTGLEILFGEKEIEKYGKMPTGFF